MRRLSAVVLWFCFVVGVPQVSADTLQTGADAPDFTLQTREGSSISLDSLRGKVVYLDFWASWCAPCRESFPFMNALEADHEGLVVLAVNLDQEAELVGKFLALYPANFTIALDPQGSAAESYGVSVMPTSYLIDRQGRLRAVHKGFHQADTERLEAAITTLLKE